MASYHNIALGRTTLLLAEKGFDKPRIQRVGQSGSMITHTEVLDLRAPPNRPALLYRSYLRLGIIYQVSGTR